MTDVTFDAEVLPSLQEHWPQIQALREPLAAELESLAVDFPGPTNRRLKSLIAWFRGAANWDEALQRPDVLSLCLPFLRHRPNPNPNPNPTNDPSLRSAGSELGKHGDENELGKRGDENELGKRGDENELAQTVRLGLCSLISRPVTGSSQRWEFLLYPVLLLAGAWVVWVGFAFWIAPEFEMMFNEFEIPLPPATMATLGLARFVRTWWWLMIAIPTASALVLWWFSRSRTGAAPQSGSSIGNLLTSSRHAIAVWAWHLSLLLESGVDEPTAISIVGNVSRKVWLRQSSRVWLARLQQLEAARKATEWDPDLLVNQPTVFSQQRKFELLNAVLLMPNSSAKIAMLRELATYYWERSSSAGGWWLKWLASLIIGLLVVLLGLIVLSLFAPLFSIISGLTAGGGGPGGFRWF